MHTATRTQAPTPVPLKLVQPCGEHPKRCASCTNGLFLPTLQLQYLISRKVDINALDWSRVSPLHLCCIENHISVAKALLKAGADCKPADKEGDLPLHWAATRGHSQVRSKQP